MRGCTARPRPVAAAIVALLLGACAGSGTLAGRRMEGGETAAWPVVERLSVTERLSCFGSSAQAKYGTRIARTAMLASPDGRYRAYAEGEALAFSDEYGPEPGCVNFSRLYLGAGARDFELVLSLSPFADLSGNSIRLVDWSPDGERLLLETSHWPYGSEFDNPDVLLLHAARSYFEALDLGRAVGAAFDRECRLSWRALGFLPDGNVAVETHSAGELYGPSCEERSSRWAVDESGWLGRLPGETRIERYGRDVGAVR